jgi:adenylate cyclase
MTVAGNHQDATALAVAGFVTRFFDGEQESGLATIDRALKLNPACATALYLGAQARGLAGDVIGASALASRALALSPFDPLAFEAHMALGEAALAEERFDDAAACFGRVVHRSPYFSTGIFFQGLALAAGGRTAEAKPVIQRGLELEPGFRGRIVHETGMGPVVGEKFLAGARMLGLPE